MLAHLVSRAIDQEGPLAEQRDRFDPPLPDGAPKDPRLLREDALLSFLHAAGPEPFQQCPLLDDGATWPAHAALPFIQEGRVMPASKVPVASDILTDLVPLAPPLCPGLGDRRVLSLTAAEAVDPDGGARQVRPHRRPHHGPTRQEAA